LGAALHLGIQLPALLRLKDRAYFPALGLDNPAVREVVRLMAPRLIGVGVVQLNFVINTILATAQGEGSLTAINVAFAVMTMPEVVIAQAIAIASLPTFSAQVARGELGEMRASLAATLRGVLLLSVPATFGLILLREPIVAMLFQRGIFDAHSTELVSWALLWYTAGLVGHSVVEILSRAFYALHDTKTPVAVGAVAMTLNVIFSIGFSALFLRIGWLPHGGLALANSLATALEGATLFILMRRRLNGIDGRRVAGGFGASLLASLAMGIAIWIWLSGAGTGLNVWLTGLGGIALGGLVYGLGLAALRVPEVGGVWGIIRRRVLKNAQS